MNNLRKLTAGEVSELSARGCHSESWERVLVSEDFKANQLLGARFSGDVSIGSGTTITNSYVANYSIGANCEIDSVSRLECRQASSFGNGVKVATINENGGRSVTLYDGLSAQVAYLWALYRHHTEMVKCFESMAESYRQERLSAIGKIGDGCRVTASNLVREVELRDGAAIEGATKVECATLLERAYVGAGVIAEEFIAAEESVIDGAAHIKRLFVGECVVVGSGFSGVDSLLFASTHLENGEAASIFAGPHTVSHHKSSLLIAGLFSFFNAGSGSNQSNHLFKSGAVHQAIHARGCKFASGAYVMAPAREGAFTMVKGSHSHHHDTQLLPYSYLIDNGGKSMLMPAANLTSYGTKRDIEKWERRDHRTVKRDVVSYNRHNPYTTWLMVQGVNTLHALSEKDGDANEYLYERTVIRSAHLRRGLNIYNKAIAAAIGDMLSRGELIKEYQHERWCDIAGAYIAQSEVERIIQRVTEGVYSTFQEVDEAFKSFADKYDNYAHSWAYSLFAQLLGCEPSDEKIAEAIESAKQAEEYLLRQTESDRRSDDSIQMAVGYGNDYTDKSVIEEDFKIVRDIE